MIGGWHRFVIVARLVLVDGGEPDLSTPPNFLKRLAELQRAGLRGKASVHELITDDWGPPPKHIVVSVTDDDGRPVKFDLDYD